MTSYDYIVVGSGSSGAVVAGRLSEDPDSRVLLIEAGGSHRHQSVQVPIAFPKQFKTKLDWENYTDPQPTCAGRTMYYPRGKMLGGCSSMNAMIYVRGVKEDYDDWARNGATGWSYDDVLPLFKRSENNSRGANFYHGVGGPQHIEDLRSPGEATQRMLDATFETGIARNPDINGATQLGGGFNQVCHKRGERQTTVDAFISPVRKRRNLTVATETHVLRVRLERDRAIGVEVEHGGRFEFIRADREVILSAGALNSPQLLMLSGIGPSEHLKERGIDAVVDSPHVGQHLAEHPFMMVNYEISAKNTLLGAGTPLDLINYMTRRRGRLTSNIAETSTFICTRPGEKLADMQIIGAQAFFLDNGFESYDKPAITFALSHIAPISEGSVRLRSRNPKDHVALDLNMFAEQQDMDSMVSAIELVREIVQAPSLRNLVGPEIHPGSYARTRAEIAQKVREGTQHTFHAACTARIGASPETGVVDPQLRVYGIRGLRVADCSVLPVITRGNTHAPAIMVGEKAADLIRADK